MASTKDDLITSDPLSALITPEVDENENSQDESEDEVEDNEELEDEETDEEEGDDDSEEEDEEEDSDEDDSDESEDEDDEDDEPEFKKRFTQIKGDTPTEYLGNLEEAYNKSSAEGIRLNKEFKDLRGRVDILMAAITSDPDISSKLEAKLGSEQTKEVKRDPALDYARSNVEAQWKGEWEEFVSANPEVATDTALNEKVIGTLQSLSATVAKTENRTLGMKEGLEMAATILKLNQITKEEKVAQAAKKQASGKSVSGSSNKKAKSKSSLTSAQLRVAKKFGYTEEQVRKFNK